MLLGLLEGLPTMLSGEVAMVLSFLIFHTTLCARAHTRFIMHMCFFPLQAHV